MENGRFDRESFWHVVTEVARLRVSPSLEMLVLFPRSTDQKGLGQELRHVIRWLWTKVGISGCKSMQVVYQRIVGVSYAVGLAGIS